MQPPSNGASAPPAGGPALHPRGRFPHRANDRTGGERGATLERSDLAERPGPSLVGGRLRLTQGGCTPLTPAEPARSFRCKFRGALTFDAPIAHHACAPTAHTLHRHLAHEDRKPAVHAWHYVRRLHQPTSFRCGPVGRRGRRSRPASQGTNTEAHCQERSERSERRTKCLLTVSVFVQAGDRIVRKKSASVASSFDRFLVSEANTSSAGTQCPSSDPPVGPSRFRAALHPHGPSAWGALTQRARGGGTPRARTIAAVPHRRAHVTTSCAGLESIPMRTLTLRRGCTRG